MEGLQIVLVVFLFLNLVVLVVLCLRSYRRRPDQERIERILREEISSNRDESSLRSREARQEMMGALKSFEGSVDQRLGQSLSDISQRLESVYKGLGQMQVLASSVGDLKKVLTNVKTRGMWGEVQLNMLLEQILTPDQYASNVVTKKDSNERVEFAIRLPGRGNDQDSPLWLPIDAKFPQEDYQRLIEAQEQANSDAAEKAARQLEGRVKAEAKQIREKYIDPPNTTDFGIMFLPTEGLYAELLRRPGLSECLQRDHRVLIAGPTTLAALLNSLQMGFKTLAIEKHSSQVWQLLGLIKAEFSKFADILDKVNKKLQETSNIVEDASGKARNIQKKLKKVEEIPCLGKGRKKEVGSG